MFKIDDRIRIKENTNWDRAEGKEGVVVLVSDPYINVTLYDPPEGSFADNWFVTEDEIELVTNED